MARTMSEGTKFGPEENCTLTHKALLAKQLQSLRSGTGPQIQNLFGCSGWIRTSTYAINSRGEYPSRHRTSNQNKTRCGNSI